MPRGLDGLAVGSSAGLQAEVNGGESKSIPYAGKGLYVLELDSPSMPCVGSVVLSSTRADGMLMVEIPFVDANGNPGNGSCGT